MKLLILVVVYEIDLYKSETIKSLSIAVEALRDRCLIFIWDNSKQAQSYKDIQLYFKEFQVDVIYKHTPENLSLSKIYNIIIDTYKNSSFNYLILFDHDTKFGMTFFDVFSMAAEKHNDINLFLPRVLYKDRLISPCRKIFLKGFYYKKDIAGVIKAKYVSAINSGMIISFEYLKNFPGYDPRLVLYGTDMDFMMKYCSSEKYIYILNHTINHDMTLSTLNPSSDKLKEVYQKMLEAWDILYNKSPYGMICVKIYSIIHSIYMAFRYKDLDYLYWR